MIHDADLTGIAMDHLCDCIDNEIRCLAGHPLAYVLIVTDGKEYAFASNMPIALSAPILKKAAIAAARRAADECDTPPPAAA
jgi:hypothetical protein